MAPWTWSPPLTGAPSSSGASPTARAPRGKQNRSRGGLQSALVGPPLHSPTQPLQSAGGQFRHLRIVALGRFAQLLHSAVHVALVCQNRSQVQPCPREVRAQADRLP